MLRHRGILPLCLLNIIVRFHNLLALRIDKLYTRYLVKHTIIYFVILKYLLHIHIGYAISFAALFLPFLSK